MARERTINYSGARHKCYSVQHAAAPISKPSKQDCPIAFIAIHILVGPSLVSRSLDIYIYVSLLEILFLNILQKWKRKLSMKITNRFDRGKGREKETVIDTPILSSE